MSEYPLKALHELLYPDKEYIPPFSGRCIFCGNNLIKGVDEDHSVCNSCWTATFACAQCGDETGECIHQNPEDAEYEIDEPNIGTYFVEGL